jgi:hypothetical protein
MLSLKVLIPAAALAALAISPAVAAANNYPAKGVTTDVNGDYRPAPRVADPSAGGQYVHSIQGHYTPSGRVANPSAKGQYVR